MKKLFDIVPSNFFSVLSSGNHEVYFDALMILHSMFKDELNIRLDDFISELSSYLEDKTFELEVDDEQAEGSLTSNAKARLIISRLEKSGWIDKELLEGSFIEIITPRNYAIPILKLLSEIGDETTGEYSSLVFATFSGLKQALSEDKAKAYEAVLSAKANTEHLQYSLRTLTMRFEIIFGKLLIKMMSIFLSKIILMSTRKWWIGFITLLKHWILFSAIWIRFKAYSQIFMRTICFFVRCVNTQWMYVNTMISSRRTKRSPLPLIMF